MSQYDLIVLGSGPAGEKGAVQAAYFGKNVLVVEKGRWVGGACVNTGTIPSKSLRESALYYSGLLQRGLYGIDYSLREGLTVPELMHRKDVVVDLERNKITQNIASHHVDFLRGEASFVDAHCLEVTTPAGAKETHSADFILIATGSQPRRPTNIPFDDHQVFDSDSILGMDRIPSSMAIIGGGVIGCEYASIFTALGVTVTLIEGRDRLLGFLDAEISSKLQDRLTDQGLLLMLNESLEKIERDGAVRTRLQSGKVIETETALVSLGRVPVLDRLRLENAGIQVDGKDALVVNEFFQTGVPHIYAAGDVIGFPALASTSMDQGRVAICHAFGIPYKKRLPQMLPLGIYTIPEISSIGETEESCHKKGIEHEVGRARYANNARGQIMGDMMGMLKLIFRRSDRELLGVHLIGELATELIHTGMMALELGATIDCFVDSIFNFPTLSEIYKYAAYDGLGNLAGRKMREG